MRRFCVWTALAAAAAMLVAPRSGQAQDNYEIQVYGADTVLPGLTMVELHSNFTIDGSKAQKGSRYAADGTFPTHHAVHETIEITRGLNNWSELGFYIFMDAGTVTGYQWVGDHIRPRVRVPDSWKWPVGASVSFEGGYQRARFSPDTWTLEIRPILDKQIGRWYLSFNPTVDKSFHGPSSGDGLSFSPNAKVGYDFTRKINAGLEYYAAYGVPGRFDSLHDQTQQIFAAADLNVSPKWEVNFGVGVGPTASTDRWIVKGILGRRFTFGRRRGVE